MASANAVLAKRGRFSLKERPANATQMACVPIGSLDDRWGEAVAITITRSRSSFPALKEGTHFADTATGSTGFRSGPGGKDGNSG